MSLLVNNSNNKFYLVINNFVLHNLNGCVACELFLFPLDKNFSNCYSNHTYKIIDKKGRNKTRTTLSMRGKNEVLRDRI